MKTIIRPCWTWLGFAAFAKELNDLYKQGWVLNNEIKDVTGFFGLRHVMTASVYPGGNMKEPAGAAGQQAPRSFR